MKTSTGIPGGTLASRAGRNFCRRMMAVAALTVCVFVAPVVAAVSRVPLREVRLPRIDSRVIENLQRWADDERDSWSEEV
jgi:hypothetical protein